MTQYTGGTLALNGNDRILVLAPHPDDEVLGCAGIIQRAVALRIPVHVVFLTYGDNNEWSFLVYKKHPVLKREAARGMGLLRHDEAVAAARILGLPAGSLTFLGYPDFGTLKIWTSHWCDRRAFRSILTNTRSVPYPNAYRRDAPYRGEEILKDLAAILRAQRPTKVFVSHPADANPDHRALYLFARVALWNVEPEISPAVYPYLIHFRGWPARKGFFPVEPLNPPTLLSPQVKWAFHGLSPADMERKLAAIRAHASQYKYSARYLLSFIRTREMFGDFPLVDFPATNAPAPLRSTGYPGRCPDAGIEEELASRQKAAFVGVEWRCAQWDGANLIVSVRLSRPLAGAVSVSVFAFGHRADRPFERMPKIHVKVHPLACEVRDQNRRLRRRSIRIVRKPREISAHIPAELMGNPRRVLASVRVYLADVPLDRAAWRVIELPEQSARPEWR